MVAVAMMLLTSVSQAPERPLVLYVNGNAATGGDGYSARGALSRLEDLPALLRSIRTSRTGPIEVILQGRIQLGTTVEFGPEASNVTFTGAGGAVVSGGRRLANWSAETLDGKAVWSHPLGDRRFRQLWDERVYCLPSWPTYHEGRSCSKLDSHLLCPRRFRIRVRS